MQESRRGRQSPSPTARPESRVNEGVSVHHHICPAGLLVNGVKLRPHFWSHRAGECREFDRAWCGCGGNWHNNGMIH